ncbi:translation elongation factor Ts [Actinospica sp.]|jgi:elongation factor Ts|uniref:translation elongation factor Ts n=1 Tax=Actinospica sp. TaxID=1872142 RepID=UPI002C9C1B95|nr:translation elongation factor Ts [Actinospica sp.]HWG28001.1 translation elongation factor Ts [Actinospica sp.]
MANYTAADIKRLREQTAAGMLDVKKALDESDGDFDKAAEYLRVKGLKGVTKREGRTASNGLVTAQISEDGSKGTLLELACETDFVAKGDRFQQVAAELLAHVVATGPAEVPSLLATTFPTSGKTVQEFVDEANATLGEKIELRRTATLEGGYVGVYLHKTSPDLPAQVGVLVQLDKANAVAAKDVAQHIAAFAPTYLSRDEVPADIVANERRLAEETSREEGKPEAALPKIVEGRVNGFFKDNVVLEQAFAKDPKKTVAKVLEEAGVTLRAFARFRVGV